MDNDLKSLYFKVLAAIKREPIARSDKFLSYSQTCEQRGFTNLDTFTAVIRDYIAAKITEVQGKQPDYEEKQLVAEVVNDLKDFVRSTLSSRGVPVIVVSVAKLDKIPGIKDLSPNKKRKNNHQGNISAQENISAADSPPKKNSLEWRRASDAEIAESLPDVLKQLKVQADNGLTEREVRRKIAFDGFLLPADIATTPDKVGAVERAMQSLAKRWVAKNIRENPEGGIEAWRKAAESVVRFYKIGECWQVAFSSSWKENVIFELSSKASYLTSGRSGSGSSKVKEITLAAGNAIR